MGQLLEDHWCSPSCREVQLHYTNGALKLQPSSFVPAHDAELRSQRKKAHTGVILIHNANSKISIWDITHKREALEPLKLPGQVEHGASVCISLQHNTKCPVWHCLVHSRRPKRTSGLLRWHSCWNEVKNIYFRVAIIKLLQIVRTLTEKWKIRRKVIDLRTEAAMASVEICTAEVGREAVQRGEAALPCTAQRKPMANSKT